MTLTAKTREFTSRHTLKESTKKAKVFDMVEPVYLKQLVKIIGKPLAASKVGLTATGLNSNLSENRTKKATELAARWLIENEPSDHPKVAAPVARTCLITADGQTLAIIKNVVKSNGGHFYLIPQNMTALSNAEKD